MLRITGNENIMRMSASFLNSVGHEFFDDKNAGSGFEEDRVFIQILSQLKKHPVLRLLRDVTRIG
jgi:hypothetical protein